MVRQQNIVYKILNYLINNQLNSLNYKKPVLFLYMIWDAVILLKTTCKLYYLLLLNIAIFKILIFKKDDYNGIVFRKGREKCIKIEHLKKIN